MVRVRDEWRARLVPEGEAAVSYLDTLVRVKDEPSIWERGSSAGDFAYWAHLGSFWWVYG